MDEEAENPAIGEARWDGGPNALALLAALVVCGVMWSRLHDAFVWWWGKANDITDSGEVILFALGLFVAFVVALMALVALEKVLRFARDLGQSMAKGWRREGERIRAAKEDH